MRSEKCVCSVCKGVEALKRECHVGMEVCHVGRQANC